MGLSIDREKVIKGLQIERECVSRDCDRDCGKCDLVQDRDWLLSVYDEAIALLKEQEDRHRLEVHNIGNVDIPEGVSEEHFHLVMNNVVEALKHTDKGESYPYEDTGR